MKIPNFTKSAAFLLLTQFLNPCSLDAAEIWWTGATSGDWSEGSNWSEGGVPAEGDLLFFGTTGHPVIDQDTGEAFAALGLRITGDAPGYAMGGGEIGLGAQGFAVHSSATHSLSNRLVLNSASTTFSVESGELRLAGGLADGTRGAAGMFKAGRGKMVLSGQSSYTGVTRLDGGETALDFSTHSNNLLVSTNSLTLGGGRLTLQTSGTNTQSLAGITIARANRSVIGFSGSGQGTLSLGSNWTREGNSGSTLTVDLTGNGKVTTQALASHTNQSTTTALHGYLVVKESGGTGFGYVENQEIKRYTAAELLTSTTASNAELNVKIVGDMAFTSGTNRYFQTLELDTRTESGSLTFVGAEHYFRLGQKAVVMNGAHDFTVANGRIGISGQELLLHQHGEGKLTINGYVSGGSGRFSKDGAGSVILNGDSNYTGATVVLNGMLQVNGSLSATSSAIIRDGGVLGGSGSINSDAELLVQNGAALAPGQSIGTLRTGSTVYEGGARFLLELADDGSGDAGTGWDQQAITGRLDLRQLSAERRLVISLSTFGSGGDAGAIASWDAAVDHVWSSFITTTEGFQGSFDASLFEIDTAGFQNGFNGTFQIALGQDGQSLDLVYHSIPEPSSVMLLSIGVLWALRGKVERQ